MQWRQILDVSLRLTALFLGLFSPFVSEKISVKFPLFTK